MPGRKFRPNVSRGRNPPGVVGGGPSIVPTQTIPSTSVPSTPIEAGTDKTTTPTSTPSTCETTLMITSPETTPTCTITDIPDMIGTTSTDNESPLAITGSEARDGSGDNTGPIHNDVVVQSALSKTTWARKKVAPKLPSAPRPRKRKDPPTDSPTQSDSQSKRSKTDENDTSSNIVDVDSGIVDAPSMSTMPEVNINTTFMAQPLEEHTSMAPPLEDPYPLMTETSLPIANTIEVSVTTPTPDDVNRQPMNSVTDDIHDQDCTTIAAQQATDQSNDNNDIHEEVGEYKNIHKEGEGDNDIHEEGGGDDDIHDETTNDSRSTRSVSETSSSSCSTDNGTKRKRSTSPSKKSKKRSSGKGKASQFKEAPDRTKMTMQELIYYNPSANPMSDKGKGNKSAQEDSNKVNESTSPTTSSKADDEDDNDGGRLVPKLKIGVNGCIEIDEESMVVETTRVKQIEYEDVIHEEGDYAMSTSFRSKRKIKKWTKEETNEFYKALSQVGTDFTMMTLILPKRTRTELKNKFKKEEKSNSGRISNAMNRLCSSRRTTPTTTAPSPTTTPTCTLAS